MYRIAIIETHPIQYKVPWFRLLDQHPEVDSTVFYCMLPDARQQGDGFGVSFAWDLPLLEGYRYRVLDNKARTPSVTSFSGCDTPGIGAVLREGWDAVIVNGWVAKSCIQTLFACRRLGLPCIVRGESNDLRTRAWWKSVIHRILLHQYSACLFIGEANRRFYARNGVRDERLFFAPYCIDNPRFSDACIAARLRRTHLRRRWGIPENALCFVFSGKFVPKKRPADMLKALALLKGDDCDGKTHLLMVGDGEMRAELEAQVRTHNLPVSFAGFLNQTELPEAYAAADCLILPSDCGETWGLVVNEAMACDLPAIVSDQVGCHHDLVDHDTTGYTFPCGDVRALAHCMASLIADHALCVKMGQAAHERVRTYSYDKVVQGTLAALRFLNVSPEQECH